MTQWRGFIQKRRSIYLVLREECKRKCIKTRLMRFLCFGLSFNIISFPCFSCHLFYFPKNKTKKKQHTICITEPPLFLPQCNTRGNDTLFFHKQLSLQPEFKFKQIPSNQASDRVKINYKTLNCEATFRLVFQNFFYSNHDRLY